METTKHPDNNAMPLPKQYTTAVTVIWVSLCFEYPRTQITSDMGTPGEDT